MLKSLSTQFAAALFFGPLGLAYSSVAGAVLLSLIFAVLYFTELGVLAVFIVWPIAMLAGLVMVKLHNDRMRHSGSRLLLGPGEEGDLISTVGSWGRGLAVLSIMAIGGYLALVYMPNLKDSKIGRMVHSIASPSDMAVSSDGTSISTEGGWTAVDSETVITGSNSGQSLNTIITLDEQQVTPVVIGTSSRPSEAVSEDVGLSAAADFNVLYVDSQRVNLRSGPGNDNSIITTVSRGDELREIGRDNNWINVIAVNSGTEGWIFGKLVSTGNSL